MAEHVRLRTAASPPFTPRQQAGQLFRQRASSYQTGVGTQGKKTSNARGTTRRRWLPSIPPERPRGIWMLQTPDNHITEGSFWTTSLALNNWTSQLSFRLGSTPTCSTFQ
jgi:hypothetical protein